jgi:cell division topological specificity factor
MSWFMPFMRRKSASVARERLQILLTHERGADGESDLIPILREEVLAAVAKHVSVDVEKVQVKIERNKAVSLLEIDIELPCNPEAAKRRKPATAKQRNSASRNARPQRLAASEAR